MTADITIVDCGIGNIRSVQRMFEAVGGAVDIATEPGAIRSCRRLVIPGVGAFDALMAAINNGWRDPLSEAAHVRRVPVLGICLGMQALARRSEEGKLDGLGWIEADVIAFKADSEHRLKIPHMGWSVVVPTRENPLLPLDREERRFYHVHKYHVRCDDASDMLANADYGIRFTTAINRENVFGVQFHPEKSHRFGMELMRRFLEIPC